MSPHTPPVGHVCDRKAWMRLRPQRHAPNHTVGVGRVCIHKSWMRLRQHPQRSPEPETARSDP